MGIRDVQTILLRKYKWIIGMKMCSLSSVISNSKNQVDVWGREGQENSIFNLTDWQKSKGLVGLVLVGW